MASKLGRKEKSILTYKGDNSIAPPPSYAEATASHSVEPHVPQPSHVIAHLKLLHAFHRLRECVRYDSSFLAIDDSWLPQDGPAHSNIVQQAHGLVRDARWNLFVKRACLRFESWWQMLSSEIGRPKHTIADMLSPKPFSPVQDVSEKKFIITPDRLPPLDVLMVWHSFLLSPRRYLEDCLLKGWFAPLPYTQSANEQA